MLVLLGGLRSLSQRLTVRCCCIALSPPLGPQLRLRPCRAAGLHGSSCRWQSRHFRNRLWSVMICLSPSQSIKTQIHMDPFDLTRNMLVF